MSPPGTNSSSASSSLGLWPKDPPHDLGLEKVLISDPTSTELGLGLTLQQLLHSKLSAGRQPALL